MLRAGIIAALAGCAATLPPVPGKGGPPWFELTSEHFTVWTDAESGRAHELVREMERLRQVIVGVAFPGASSGRILVVAVRDDDELRLSHSRRESRAFAIPAVSPLFQPVIILSAFSNYRQTDLTITHELSHAISFAMIHHQPRWFAEGLAMYFETLQLDSDAATADVGVAPQQRGRRPKMPGLVPISTLLAWKGDAPWSPTEARLYSTAWALFTFLINEHRAELMRYMELLDEPPSTERSASRPPERTWSQAFPSLPLTRIDGELRNWLVSGHHLVLHYRVAARDWPSTERTLTDAEVHAVQAYLIADLKQEHDKLTAALALEPTNILARLLGMTHWKMKVSAVEARAIAAAHRDDWRAWWLAAMAIYEAEGRTPEGVAAERNACALIAQNPAVTAPPGICQVEQASATSP